MIDLGDLLDSGECIPHKLDLRHLLSNIGKMQVCVEQEYRITYCVHHI